MKKKQIANTQYKQDIVDLIETVSKLKPIQIERFIKLIAESETDGQIEQTLWGYQWVAAGTYIEPTH